MSYKTILVHIDHTKHTATRIRLAAKIALQENAHLIATAMTGISMFAYGAYGAGSAGSAGTLSPGDPSILLHLEALRERARLALNDFEVLVRELGVASYETRLVEDDAASGVCLQARYCDLVVIGQTDAEIPSPSVTADFPEYVTLNCARPVLIVPSKGNFDQIGQNIMLSWNGSQQATRAISAALSFLQQAKKVQLVVFNADTDDYVHGAEPGADMALYLARQDVRVEVVQISTAAGIGDAILSRANEMSADLIVMGAYGHSRFREIILGGASRSIFSDMTVPVLFSH